MTKFHGEIDKMQIIKEEWRLSYVKNVMVSSIGRVIIIPSIGKMPRGGRKHYGCVARFGDLVDKRMIFVYKGKTYKIHRLVCEAFNGPPPFDKAICMHIDENPQNNHFENLKWGTQKENLNAPGFLAYCKSRTGENNPHIKGRMKKNIYTQKLVV